MKRKRTLKEISRRAKELNVLNAGAAAIYNKDKDLWMWFDYRDPVEPCKCYANEYEVAFLSTLWMEDENLTVDSINTAKLVGEALLNKESIAWYVAGNTCYAKVVK